MARSYRLPARLMVVVALIAGSLGLAAPAFADPSVPDAPTNARALPGEDAGVFVTADVPADHGDPIVSYTATCDSSNGGPSGSHSDNAPNIFVPLLVNGFTYTCTMTATNGQGESAPSAPSNQVNVASPAIDTAVASPGDGVIYVTPPGGITSRVFVVQTETAECTSSNGGAFGIAGMAGGFSTTITVSGVTNGKTYTCVLYADNNAGTGPPSLTSNAVVPNPTGIPPAPPNSTLITLAPQDDGIIADFPVPAAGGDPPSTFEVECTSNDGGAAGISQGGTLPVVVTGLDNGKSYDCRARAMNTTGWGLWSDPLVGPVVPGPVPDAPDKPTVFGHGTAEGTTVNVAFDPPADNGNAITNYTASCVSSDGGVSGSKSGASSPIDVGHLSGGSTYTCTVVATNAAGDSTASPASDPVVTGLSVPDPPTNAHATGGAHSASVTFDVPRDGGDPITGYTVTCVSSDGGATGTASGPSSPINVTGLTTYKTYACNVVATNGLGNSDPSDDSNAPQVDPDVPAAPDSVDVVPGDGSLDVSIDPGDDGGGAITGYAVDCVSSDGGSPGSASGAGSPLTVNGLDNGHSYTCTGTVTNGAGTSAGTAAAPMIVGTPRLEGATFATNNNGNLVTLFAGLPHDNGAPILSWTATCTSSDGGAPGTATGSSSILTVTGLDDGHTYVCNIRATNSRGTGRPALDSNPTMTDSAAPPGPTDVSLTRGSGQITASFTLPADDLGDPITAYAAICVSADGGATGQTIDAGSPIVVTGLDNGHKYYCATAAAHTSGKLGVSDFVGPVTPGAVSEPDVPTNVVTTPGAVSASVAFDAPVDNGGDAITSYTATCTSSDGGVTRSAVGTSSPIVVSALTGGKTYTCTVIATNGHGDSDDSDVSNAVVVLAGGAAPANTVRPSVTGSAIVQRTLTAHKGTWSGAPTSYAYQWQRCDNHGGHCTNISRATKRTYLLKNGDTDHTIRIRVTARNANGSTARISRATKVIRWIPMSISGPYFYNGSGVYQGGIFSVGAASHGNSVWTTYANGYVLGPRFGPGDGTLVRTTLKQPIVSIVATPTGRGYWMFASDGGIFAFGDAHFYGSTGAKKLVAPIVSMAVTPDGHGYWLFAADGGVFTFGNARFYGSTGGQTLDHPVVAMLSTPSGHGYWLVTSNGAVLRFGDATKIGNVKYAFRNDITGIVSTGDGYRFVTKTLQLLAPR